jgi:alpha-galactosidase
LTIGGQTFERGVGTHSVSEIAIQLDGKAVSFTAQVGLDDEIIEHKTSAEFIVIGDGARLWSSGIVKAGDAPKLCSVSLDGVKRLELIVADGGDGPYYDLPTGDAKIISKGKKSFPTLKFIATEPYILTPPAPATPRINGASVLECVPVRHSNIR